MKIDIQPGTYVVAVSGGVDSVVLLDILRQQKGLNLAVAHFDHGIRSDSAKDRKLVADLAKNYGLSFVYDNGLLGAEASEDEARVARYNFLEAVRLSSRARRIVTAHHQDDAVETAILHILRGTGRRGLSAMSSRDNIERPLLDFSKKDILNYAQSNGLVWNEDSTNVDTRYARNKVRHKLVPKFNKLQGNKLRELLANSRLVNKEIDDLLELMLHVQDSQSTIDRQWFIGLPHTVSAELLTHWLRRFDIRGFNRKQIERLMVSIKTLPPGRRIVINKSQAIEIKTKTLALVRAER